MKLGVRMRIPKRRDITGLMSVFVIITAMIFTGCTDDGGEESIKVVTLAPIDMQTSLESGDIAGYVAWEPYCSDSVVNQKGKDLYRSEDIWPHHPCCVVAVHKDFAGSKPDLVRHFLKAHIEANIWIADALSDNTSANYTLLVNIAKDFTARSEAVVKEALTHMTYTYELNAAFYDGLKKYTDKLIEFDVIDKDKISTRGYDSTQDFVNKYVNETYLVEAGSVPPTTTNLGTVRVGYLLGDLHQLAYPVAKNSQVGGGQSLFEMYGVTVTDAPGAPYSNGGDEMDHFEAGDVDMGYLGSAPAVLKHINAGIKTMILAQVNNEGSAIIVANDINSLKDLRGKKFGIPGFPTVQYFLLRIIAEEEDIKVST
jgi:NitT/TauT family transport system substrate-binding protein